MICWVLDFFSIHLHWCGPFIKSIAVFSRVSSTHSHLTHLLLIDMYVRTYVGSETTRYKFYEEKKKRL